VRSGQDVGLSDARKAIDGTAVKGHALIERIFEFRGRDVKRLVSTENVGEPELYETNTALFHGSKNVLCLIVHGGHSRTFFGSIHLRR
jgi:hypothetical protein